MSSWPAGLACGFWLRRGPERTAGGPRRRREWRRGRRPGVARCAGEVGAAGDGEDGRRRHHPRRPRRSRETNTRWPRPCSRPRPRRLRFFRSLRQPGVRQRAGQDVALSHAWQVSARVPKRSVAARWRGTGPLPRHGLAGRRRHGPPPPPRPPPRCEGGRCGWWMSLRSPTTTGGAPPSRSTAAPRSRWPWSSRAKRRRGACQRRRKERRRWRDPCPRAAKRMNDDAERRPRAALGVPLEDGRGAR